MTATEHPLIDVTELAEALAAPADPPTVIDVRWHLRPPGSGHGGPVTGLADYAAGHLPGAVFLDLDGALCGPPGGAGRHPLPDPGTLERAFRAAGVREGRPVVVYDGGDGLAAARTWWTLRWAGHGAVRVLDGGYPAWIAAGQPTTTEAPAPAVGDFTVRPGALPAIDAADAARLAAEGVLLDVRTAPRYRGETEPIDPVAGHIPGAVNLPATEHTAPDGRYRAADELRERFADAGVADGLPVGAYCGSGVTAAHTVLALHAAGRTDAALYVGSWSNWIADPSRPIATGEKP